MAGPLMGLLGGGGGGGGGITDMLGGLLGGGGGGGGPQALPTGPTGGNGPYAGIATALSDGQVITNDLMKQLSMQGEGPSDSNLIRNLFGTLLGDPGTEPKIVKVPTANAGVAASMVQPGREKRPGVLGGLLGGTFQALLGGGMGFVQNKGIESVVAALTAAGATGFTPASIQPAIAAFFGSGGAQAIAGAGEQGSRGFRKGGGTAAASVLAHELGGNAGQLADVLTNGAVKQMLGTLSNKPGDQGMPDEAKQALMDAKAAVDLDALTGISA